MPLENFYRQRNDLFLTESTSKKKFVEVKPYVYYEHSIFGALDTSIIDFEKYEYDEYFFEVAITDKNGKTITLNKREIDLYPFLKATIYYVGVPELFYDPVEFISNYDFIMLNGTVMKGSKITSSGDINVNLYLNVMNLYNIPWRTTTEDEYEVNRRPDDRKGGIWVPLYSYGYCNRIYMWLSGKDVMKLDGVKHLGESFDHDVLYFDIMEIVKKHPEMKESFLSWRFTSKLENQIDTIKEMFLETVSFKKSIREEDIKVEMLNPRGVRVDYGNNEGPRIFYIDIDCKCEANVRAEDLENFCEYNHIGRIYFPSYRSEFSTLTIKGQGLGNVDVRAGSVILKGDRRSNKPLLLNDTRIHCKGITLDSYNGFRVEGTTKVEISDVINIKNILNRPKTFFISKSTDAQQHWNCVDKVAGNILIDGNEIVETSELNTSWYGFSKKDLRIINDKIFNA